MYVYIYIDHGCGLGSVRHLRVSSRRQHSALSPLAPPEKPTRNRLLHPECVRRRLASTASLSTDTPSMLSSPQGRRGASRSGPDFARGLFPGRKERRPAPSFTGLFVPCAVGSFLPFWASVLLPPDTCPLGPRSLRLSLLFLRVIISPLLGNTPPKNTDDPSPPVTARALALAVRSRSAGSPPRRPVCHQKKEHPHSPPRSTPWRSALRVATRDWARQYASWRRSGPWARACRRRRRETAPGPSVGCWRERTRGARAPGRRCSREQGQVLGGRRIGPLGMGGSRRHGRPLSGTNPPSLQHLAIAEDQRTGWPQQTPASTCESEGGRAARLGRFRQQARRRSSQLHFQT